MTFDARIGIISTKPVKPPVACWILGKAITTRKRWWWHWWLPMRSGGCPRRANSPRELAWRVPNTTMSIKKHHKSLQVSGSSWKFYHVLWRFFVFYGRCVHLCTWYVSMVCTTSVSFLVHHHQLPSVVTIRSGHVKYCKMLPSDQVEGGHHETHASQQHHGDASDRSASEEDSQLGPGLQLAGLRWVHNDGNTRKN